MTCAEAIAYIHSIPRFPPKPGLSRMTALMARLGNPQNLLRFVHIAGTNGKGSTAAMAAAVLSAAGYRTGLFTSPYLEDFRERITVGGAPISPAALSALTEKVKAQAVAMEAAGEGAPTAFEVVAAVGFLYFWERRCAFVVLETGLGGRFDATNVIPSPPAAAITSISRDHTGILGDTLEAIAAEKCGILKPGGRAVTAPGQTAGVLSVIRAHCRGLGIPLLEPERPSLSQVKTGLWGASFPFGGETYTIPLLGLHQVDNALAALGLMEQLRAVGVSVPRAAEREGLAGVRWPGRLELLCRAPFILLDTAHNPGGVISLCEALDRYFPGAAPVTVMGMLADKEYALCAAEVARRSRTFLAVSPPGMPRALSAGDFAASARPFCSDVRGVENLAEAIETGLALTGDDGLLLVCGSIPLAGAARRLLRSRLAQAPGNFEK